VIASSEASVDAPKEKRIPLLRHLLTRDVTRVAAMLKKGNVVLHQIWRMLYKPVLDHLFRESASKRVRLTPDLAIEQMEKFFESVFLCVKEEGSSATNRVPAPSPRLYFRFGHVTFRREAHHYAIDLFYDTYFPRNHEAPQAASNVVGGGSRRSALQRGTRVMSQPQMIREVLLEHGGPLYVDKIARAIEKTFDVKLKTHDITSVIYRAMREKKFFRKQGINTFALVE
jgi:hypothetical protein